MPSVVYALFSALALWQAHASTQPEQVHLAYAGRSAAGYPDGMSVCWFTRDTTNTSTVRYGLNQSVSSQSSSAVPAREYVRGYGFHHSVILSNLVPATRYFYQVGDAAGGWSSISSFISASDKADISYTVGVFGDMGYLGSKERPLVLPPVEGLVSNWSAVPTRALLERLRGRLDSLLLVGDISYADDAFGSDLSQAAYEEVYNGYMNWMANLSSVMPWMVTVGNHESECHSPACLMSPELSEGLRNFTAYNARFAMPSASSKGVLNMWYSYNTGPVHWISINSETDWHGAGEEHAGDSGLLPAGGFAPNGTYLAWLEADLMQAAQERSIRPWVIAFGHRPYDEIQQAMGALFVKYGVDLYLAGHQHSYSRSGPIRGGEVEGAAMLTKNHYHYRSSGTCTYIVIGSAGCDEMDYLYDPKTNKITQSVRQHVPGLPAKWRVVDVIKKVSAGVLSVLNGSALNFTLYDSVTDAILDTVLITK